MSSSFKNTDNIPIPLIFNSFILAKWLIVKVHRNWTMSQKFTTAWPEEDTFLRRAELSWGNTHKSPRTFSLVTNLSGGKRGEGPTGSRRYVFMLSVTHCLRLGRRKESSAFKNGWLKGRLSKFKSKWITFACVALGKLTPCASVFSSGEWMEKGYLIYRVDLKI